MPEPTLMSCFAKPNRDLIRDIPIANVLTHYGVFIGKNSKAQCPFHNDNNPSMIVNHEYCYCFACGRGWNTVEVVMEKEGLDENAAILWLTAHKDELPETNHEPRKRGEYLGPVNSDLVEYWHKFLLEEEKSRLNHLYTHRLLTQETIVKYKIGWRPEYNTYALPIWDSELKEIVTVQFRRTDDSPEWHPKFSGLGGHTKPYLVGLDSIQNKTWTVLLFGTYDAILCTQDGFPCISPNGVSAFTNKQLKDELNTLLFGIERVYVVPDRTESEKPSVNRMLALLDKEIIFREFPEEFKDYGEYRLSNTAFDFYKLLFGMAVFAD